VSSCRIAFACLLSVSVGACGGGDGSAAPSTDTVADTVAGGVQVPLNGPIVLDDAVDADIAVQRLEARLATRFVDDARHDSWVCLGESLSSEYRLTVDDDGARRGVDLDGRGLATGRAFGWAAIGPDSVLLDYADEGRQTEIASILFADDDAFRASDGASGTLECRRQRYVDGEPTRGEAPDAPEDIDRDAEAAARLSARVETRRPDGHYWYCERESAPPSGYLLAAPGVLDDLPLALIFDALAVDAAGDGGAPAVDPEDGTARAFRWLATDGTTLVLVPLEANVASGDGARGTVATSLLQTLVFSVDDAFTATDQDGTLLQCLRSPTGG